MTVLKTTSIIVLEGNFQKPGFINKLKPTDRANMHSYYEMVQHTQFTESSAREIICVPCDSNLVLCKKHLNKACPRQLKHIALNNSK